MPSGHVHHVVDDFASQRAQTRGFFGGGGDPTIESWSGVLLADPVWVTKGSESWNWSCEGPSGCRCLFPHVSFTR